MTDDQRDLAVSSAAGKRRGSWRRFMVIVLAAIVLMLFVKAFVVQVYRIPSASMEDTLLTGDRVLVNKLVYHFRSIGRGDIVVFSGQGSWAASRARRTPRRPATRFCERWTTCSPTPGSTARRRTTSSGSSACPATTWPAARTAR